MSRAAPQCFTQSRTAHVVDEVAVALAATDEERTAASATAMRLMQRADARDKDGPLVHAWAVHAAFLAGLAWARKEEE
jgi:hypothetical protein